MSEVPPNQQGLKILGAPFGHREFVAAQLEKKLQKQETLIRRITLVPDLQSAWLILHCASAKANFLLRVVDLVQVQQFAQVHDERLWQCQCLCQLLGITVDLCDDAARSAASLLLVLGGLVFEMAGFQNQDGRVLDCLPMIEARHPEVAAQVIAQLEGHPHGHSLRAAADAAHSLAGVRGFEVPSWRALAAGLRPPCDAEEFKTGWQHEASSRIEQEHRETLFRVMAEPERALTQVSRRFWSWGSAASTCPTCPVAHMDPTLFRCDVCVSLCCCPRASAGVAVHSIPVVTTEQLAHRVWVLGRRGFAAGKRSESQDLSRT